MITSIIIKIPVNRPGQMGFFDIHIPSDATMVIDACTALSGMVVPHSTDLKGYNIAGTLTLQATGIASMCYSSAVAFAPSPVEEVLPGIEIVNSEVASLFASRYYENDYRQLPRTGAISSYTLYGCYEDLIGRQVNAMLSYNVTLCLWLRTEELKHAS